MSQSLSKVYIHCVFGTFNGYPHIHKNIRERLNAYLAGAFKSQDSPPIKVNCVSDHVHILLRMSKKIPLMKILEEVKKQSSKWMKEPEQGITKFKWQDGYAAFSVSSTKLAIVEKYIENQEEHHKKMTFKEEIEEYMNHYKVSEYNSKYFFE